MVRRIHRHESGSSGPCDCPNPLAPEPVLGSEAIWGRPPPSGYRDEHEVYHPGPGSDGYCGHLRECLPCFQVFGNALNRGARWAEVLSPLPQLPPIVMPIPGPGMPREQLGHGALVRLRPQHIGPAAVAMGAVSYAITALLAWWLAAPMLVGLLALMVWAGRRDLLEVDRTPPARLLRR